MNFFTTASSLSHGNQQVVLEIGLTVLCTCLSPARFMPLIIPSEWGGEGIINNKCAFDQLPCFKSIVFYVFLFKKYDRETSTIVLSQLGGFIFSKDLHFMTLKPDWLLETSLIHQRWPYNY